MEHGHRTAELCLLIVSLKAVVAAKLRVVFGTCRDALRLRNSARDGLGVRVVGRGALRLRNSALAAE